MSDNINSKRNEKKKMAGKQYKKRKFTKIKHMAIDCLKTHRVPSIVNDKRCTTMCITVKLQNSKGENCSVGKKKEHKESELKKASAFSRGTENWKTKEALK